VYILINQESTCAEAEILSNILACARRATLQNETSSTAVIKYFLQRGSLVAKVVSDKSKVSNDVIQNAARGNQSVNHLL